MRDELDKVTAELHAARVANDETADAISRETAEGYDYSRFIVSEFPNSRQPRNIYLS